MTIVTNVGYLRPRSHEHTLRGASLAARSRSIARLLEMGLLRDQENRRLRLMDPLEAERRLKARGEDQ